MVFTKLSARKYSPKRRRVYSRSAMPRYDSAVIARVPSRVKDVPDWASCSCVEATANPVVNQMYQFNTLDLNSFDRAAAIARGYQFFRMKKLTFRFRPTYDTYIANGGNSKMNLYYMIDKSGSVPVNPTLASLRSMGAKPIQLDEKVTEISFAPSVLDSVLVDGGAAPIQGAGQYTISPWLSTNATPTGAAWTPSVVDHLGISFIVEQAFANAQTSYELEIEAQFEFKKPLWIVPANPPAPPAMSLQDLQHSAVGAGAGV